MTFMCQILTMLHLFSKLCYISIHRWAYTALLQFVRILSFPGKSTWPVIISARMQAADQTSTVRGRHFNNGKTARNILQQIIWYSAIFFNKLKRATWIKARLHYYLFDCSASSWIWPLVLCTSASQHTQSSHSPSVLPDQNPGSGIRLRI